MLFLKNDYCGIAHPKVLEDLLKYQNEMYNGYGLDDISLLTKKLIKKELKNENVDIHFLVGGTITNKILIAHTLKPYEAVIAADTGHINVHETGAIEQTGHKVVTVKNHFGKVLPCDVLNACNIHTDEHMVKPKMLYISNTTETGSVYTLSELTALSKVCKELGLYFYLDGARLSCALTSNVCDYTMADLTNLVDAFYIGGTKNGQMMGEALVIINENIKKDFRYSVKHFGGMYSKGFVNALGFYSMFKDGLFYEVGKNANNLAIKLYEELCKKGIHFSSKPESNQIFPIFSNEIINKLENEIAFELWEKGDNDSVIRFVTSYMTKEEDIKEAIKIISKYL